MLLVSQGREALVRLKHRVRYLRYLWRFSGLHTRFIHLAGNGTRTVLSPLEGGGDVEVVASVVMLRDKPRYPTSHSRESIVRDMHVAKPEADCGIETSWIPKVKQRGYPVARFAGF